ncbi:uncharacterized protein PFL1_02837 [Pseudozyma flocculosa PF-1]|uniref:FAD/NAD(P)-binding domain-containing protein n=1 Tax=Pseudozyma flocculosa PF-1 TaxID=1277687 RepID=A0A061HAH6_9BASI|nr:uncharacterized protein PFL1_02837 [Pseudozyma flocculosa PF-1]EPQ29618.1 hypothetical protein PFL1_02837 [Pseudozyma flocculosa PF-1]
MAVEPPTLLYSHGFSQDDIAVIDPSEWHHYQPGWTLVGGGLKNKEDLRRPLKSLLDPKLKHYAANVQGFSPDDNLVTLANGDRISYDQLVVVPGIGINFDAIKGLPEALQDPDSLVSSIYGYDTCDKVFATIERFKGGNAIFTQPAGVIKCAGAPQKAMWLALDHWKRAGLYDPADASKSAISIDFATGLPVMFGVPKYSARLEELRKERGVNGLFQHDLVAIEDGNTAVFARPDGAEPLRRKFDLMHVTPKMGPLAFVKESPLADGAGFVDVDQGSTRHKRYDNVWSIGDASSLPTSKTAAAITAETPVLVRNLTQTLAGKEADASYDGYTSCPLLTEYGKVMLAEFKYGGQPKETFGNLFGIDQATPRRAFYHLKKDFFPWVYYKSYVKGAWAGPKGWGVPLKPGSVAGTAGRTFSTAASPGETFIVRPPPTSGTVASTTLIPQPLLSAPTPTPAAEAADRDALAALPPALKRNTRKGAKMLTSEQIAEVQQLRQLDPINNTAGRLAKRFGCTPLFIQIVAPAPKVVKEGRLADAKLRELTWGANKRLAKAERDERRKLW